MDIRNWYLTLPTGKDEKPDIVRQPELSKLNNDWFFVDGTALVFRTPAGGATTKKSGFARCELRETNRDGSLAAWKLNAGTHSLQVTQSVDVLPRKRKCVCVAQIHDGKDEVVMVRLLDTSLQIMFDDEVFAILDDRYELKSKYELTLSVKSGQIQVRYKNGSRTKTVRIPEVSNRSCFFKTGSYIQTSPKKYGESKDAIAEVRLYRLSVAHAGEE